MKSLTKKQLYIAALTMDSMLAQDDIDLLARDSDVKFYATLAIKQGHRSNLINVEQQGYRHKRKTVRRGNQSKYEQPLR